jgi:hypothetical protein
MKASADRSDRPIPSIEQTLYNIARRADVTVLREAYQSLADFAETVKEAIAEKIIELDEHIDEIDTLDIEDDEEDGQ